MREKGRSVRIYQSAYNLLIAHCIAHDKNMCALLSKIIKNYIKGDGSDESKTTEPLT